MKNILRVAILVSLLVEVPKLYSQSPPCPAVTTPANVVIPCGQTCTNLIATAFAGAQTTSYTVDSIGYDPLLPFNTGTQIANMNSDDIYSDTISLPFNFCFFGFTYNNIIVGTNGNISFNLNNANIFDDWDIVSSAPFVNPGDLRNSIMAPWQDIDPTYEGAIYYNVGGTAPCRYFAVSWYQCPMFGDPNSSNTGFCTIPTFQTQQAVLYETTNIIDINIQNKSVICNNVNGYYWNNGWAIEGIQNDAGSVAYTVPGRNATQWTATNDAYRFTPSGSPNYSITWFQGATVVGTGDTINVCPATPTTYTATAFYTNCDNSVVTVSSDVNVGFDSLSILVDSIHKISCSGNDGAVFATYYSNVGIVSFGWSPGVAGLTQLTNLGPGTYIFSVTDSSGCTLSDTVILTNPVEPVVTVANDTVAPCAAAIAGDSLTAVVTGVSGPILYLWSNTQTTQTIYGLDSGSYSVTVTDSLGCTASATGSVVETGSPLTLNTAQVNDVSCFGGNDGSIIASVSGGTPPITFQWSFGSSTGDTLSGLTVGIYSVTAIDVNGCSASAIYVVREPSPIIFGPPVLTNPSCSYTTDGSIIVSANGGTGNITYSWTPAASGDTLTGLAGGTYTVTATDANLCTASASYTLIAPPAIVFGAPTISNPSCNSSDDGSITISTTGGTGIITYVWSTGALGNNISGLGGGVYSVTATDANGCTASASFSLSNPSSLVFGPDTLVNPTCSYSDNGSISISASGGTGTIIYTWSPSGTGSELTGLSGGIYTVTATDLNSCSITASYTLTAPSAITFGAGTVNQPTCNGTSNGSITVSATGGTGAITYTWSPSGTGNTIGGLRAGTFTVTATDSNGCTASASYTLSYPPALVFDSATLNNPTCSYSDNGSIIVAASGGTGTITFSWTPSGTGDTLSGLAAGTYTVTATDSNGCTDTASYTLTAPSPITFGPPTIIEPTCTDSGSNNGSITASATGGTGTITYSWGVNGTGSTISGLGSGTYTVTATDSLGCSASASYMLSPSSSIVFDSAVLVNPTCNGISNGSITVSASGGNGTITFVWSTAATGSSISGLVGGTYGVTATDSLGCSASTSYTLNSPTAITFGPPTLVNPSCSGEDNGSITVSASGGTGTINYAWSPSDTGATITDLGPGTYSVTATDSLGCSASASYNLTQTPAIVFGNPTIVNPSCGDTTGGSITVITVGGSGPITYTWNTGATDSAITGLGAGTYSVTASDTTGCSTSASYTLSPAFPIEFGNPTIVNPSCGDSTGGSITIFTAGGSGPISYIWNTGATSSSLTGLVAGNYSVTATDTSGCSASAFYSLNQASPLSFGPPTLINPTCSTSSDGSITVNVLGASGTITYTWSPSGSTNPLTGLTGGTYDVTVSDTTGCSATASYTLTQPTPVVLGTPTITNAGCGGTDNGSISVTATGGTGTISYIWSTGATTNSITGLAGGTYTLTASDANGCSVTASYSITQSAGVVFGNPVITNVSCTTGLGGSITASATGTGPVTYVWSNGATTATISNLSAGTYCVTATDSTGCSANTCYNISQASPLVIDSAAVTPVQCGGTVGSIALTVTGGTLPYTYTWSGGYTGNPLDSLPPGSYSVTVTDSNGCSATAYYIVGHSSCGGCPAVNTNNNVTIPCSESCTTLTATAFSAAQTTSYTVSQIPYNPPYAYDSGTAVLVHTDDLWSSVIDLPFTFCFFGNPYTKIIVGSNGDVSFNTANAGLFNSWEIPGPLPFASPTDVLNGIMAPWQDLDPTHQGTIYYQLVGTAPCRQFEVSWDNCAMYGDPNSVDASGYCTIPTHQTQQAVFYETTNAIDINILNKSVICNNVNGTYWNNGWAIEGIVDAAGGFGGGYAVVPGRNATQWTATDDAWRFTPSGAPNYVIEWFHGGDSIGTGTTLQVCPDSSTIYDVQATYTNCDNSVVVVADSVFVTPGGSLQIIIDSIHNITCAGNDGAIYASFTSSSQVSSFGWTPNGANLTAITNLGPGTYIFTVTTVTGCTKSDTVTLTGPPPLLVSVNNDTISVCDSASSPGTLTANASGGTPSYSYTWNNLATTETITDVGPGTYTITVTDSAACTASASGSIILLPPSTVTFDSAIITNVTCGGASTGSITVSVSGATPPVVFTWSNGLPNGSTQTGLAAGTYTVTATDRYGCSATASYTITQPAPIVFGPPVFDTIICNGGTGCIIVSASGGTGIITYNWGSGPSTSDTACGLTAGTYTVTATDSLGCTATATYNLSQPPAIQIDSVTIIPATCTAGGALIVYASGGTGTLTYVWSNTDTGDSIGGLAAGPYGLTITDANGCSITATLTDTASPLVVHFGPPILSEPGCYGDSSGCIEAVGLGGQGTITYVWSNGDSGSTICGLPAGTYSVTITDTTGCSASTTYILGQPTQVALAAPTIDSITCFGAANGSITANGTGGTPPYSYSWGGGQTTQTISNLSPGTYCVTATDSLGCSASACYTIGQPTPVVIDSITSTLATCTTGGTFTVYASGGTGTYTYTWTGGITGNPATGFAAGTYTVTVADQNGCSITASDSIGQAPGAVYLETPIIVNEICNGDSNGSIIVVATDSGVGGPITYLWGNGATTDTISGLIAGTYCVTATDSAGCTASACYNVSQPAAITLTPVFTPITCSGDSNGCISVVATGGTGNITYVWASGATSDTICNLPAGSYTVTATDSAGCTASATFNLVQPAPVTISTTVTNITCNGSNNGIIIVSASGGTGTITYAWSSGQTSDTISGLSVGQYCVTATDSVGCSASACDSITQPSPIVIDTAVVTQVTCTAGGSITVTASGGTGVLTYTWLGTSQTGDSITNLTAGQYCLTITDANGCTDTACYTVTNSAALVVIDSAVVLPVTCTTQGSITLTVSGGTGPLTYLWSPTEPDTNALSNLTTGTYAVTVIDSVGCSATASYNVADSAVQVTLTAVLSNVTCNNDSNGSISVTAAGGSGGFTYIWNGGQTTATITGLAGGQYCLTVTSANGCSDSSCYTIINPAPVVIDTAVVIPVTCSTNGSISVTASGGTGQLTYTWTNTVQTGAIITNLTVGQYCLTVADSNGCSDTACYTITSTSTPVTLNTPTITNNLCNGGDSGSITAIATGGTGITYSWSNLASTQTITGLTQGQYCVTATNSVGCSDSACYNLVDPPAITYSSTVTPAGCGQTGYVIISASGGTGQLTYTWSLSGQTTDTLTVTTGGTYTLTISDQNHCSVTASFDVTSGTQFTLTDTITDAGCTHSGQVTVTPAGGSGDYSYEWSTLATTETITGLAAGTYCVTVHDLSSGCSASMCYTVNQASTLSASVASHVICPDSTGTLNAVVTGGVPPYTYSWSIGQGDVDTVTDVIAQNMVKVTVTDASGCSATAEGEVTQEQSMFYTIFSSEHCNNPLGNDSVSAIKYGTPPYILTLIDTALGYDTTQSSHQFYNLLPGTYALTVTDSIGCESINSFKLSELIGDSTTAQVDSASCPGVDNGEVILTPTDSTLGPFTYDLNGVSQSDSIFTNLAPGTYDFTVTDNEGCNYTDSVTVPSMSVPNVHLIDTLWVIRDDSMTLTDSDVIISGFTPSPVFSWTPSTGLSCTNCEYPTLTVLTPTVYYLTVTDSAQTLCAASDSMVVLLEGGVVMPNAFTPNGDGIDDLFGPVRFSYGVIKEFHIYNRWGELVHNSTDYWDGTFKGKVQPAGVYVYYIEFQYFDEGIPADHATPSTGNISTTYKQEGSVTLLR